MPEWDRVCMRCLDTMLNKFVIERAAKVREHVAVEKERQKMAEHASYGNLKDIICMKLTVMN